MHWISHLTIASSIECSCHTYRFKFLRHNFVLVHRFSFNLMYFFLFFLQYGNRPIQSVSLRNESCVASENKTHYVLYSGTRSCGMSNRTVHDSVALINAVSSVVVEFSIGLSYLTLWSLLWWWICGCIILVHAVRFCVIFRLLSNGDRLKKAMAMVLWMMVAQFLILFACQLTSVVTIQLQPL